MMGSPPGNRVVFWDFDGTLARRHELWSGALVDALRLFGPTPVTAADLRPYVTQGFPWHRPEQVVDRPDAAAWWRRLTPVLVAAYRAVGVSPSIAALAADRVGEQFYRLDAWELIAGAAAALEITRRHGYANVVLSNHPPELPRLVTDLGLDPSIDLVITSASVGAEKPNPLIFAHALRLSGAGPDCWMVGDNPVADVQGARAAGIRAILADGAYPDSRGVTVLQAARQLTGRPDSTGRESDVRMRHGMTGA
ncbi:MAG: HAD-IA family hydrolase [Microlunatus sp.]|nr:HAD-IA family hydrolase [Microlunatus sp.]